MYRRRWRACALPPQARAESSRVIASYRYEFVDVLTLKLNYAYAGSRHRHQLQSMLAGAMPDNFDSILLTFSARTSANQTQDIIDGKLEKRRKGVFGPPAGKRAAVFIDDLNMPQREKYGAQPPLELVRQWMDHGGWYERAPPCAFRRVVDAQVRCKPAPRIQRSCVSAALNGTRAQACCNTPQSAHSSVL